MADLETGTRELSRDELLSRVDIARSVLGHAPLYRLDRKHDRLPGK